MTKYRDDELLAVLPFARGDDRTVLVGALGESVDVAGSGAAEELVRIFHSEKGQTRAAALHALAQRLGEGATPYGIDALHSTSWGLQAIGAQLLADHGAPAARDAFFAWFERKLRAKDRREFNWGRYDLLDMVRFGVRCTLHQDVARLLTAGWERLADDERRWLERYWPGMFDTDGRPLVTADTPPPTRVGVWMEEEMHPDPTRTEEQKLAGAAAARTLQDSYVDEAYGRASNRMRRAQLP